MSNEGGLAGRLQPAVIGSGAIAGILAYGLGFVIIYATKSETVRNVNESLSILGAFGTQIDFPSTWRVASWLFYSAHGAALDIEVSGVDSADSEPMDAVVELLWEGWFLLVPILAIMAAGVVVGVLASHDARRGFLAGATVVFGYGPLGIAGVFLTGWSGSITNGPVSIEATVSPAIVTGMLLVGLVYPLVGGAIGGAIGGELRRRTATEPPITG